LNYFPKAVATLRRSEAAGRVAGVWRGDDRRMRDTRRVDCLSGCHRRVFITVCMDGYDGRWRAAGHTTTARHAFMGRFAQSLRWLLSNDSCTGRRDDM